MAKRSARHAAARHPAHRAVAHTISTLRREVTNFSPREVEFYEKNRRDILFFAFIFIGLGLGEWINQAGAGLIGGIGLGILVTDYLKQLRESAIVPRKNPTLYMFALIIFYFIALVLSYIYNNTVSSQYSTAILTIVMGAVLLVLYYKSARKYSAPHRER